MKQKDTMKYNKKTRTRCCEYFLNKYNGKCCYCGDKVTLKTAHLDHFIAKSHDGGNEEENIRLSCIDCNLRKHCLSPYEWLLKIADYVRVEELRIKRYKKIINSLIENEGVIDEN
jgi:5-methylcytosine-specific restriction endonuclease McrA